MFWPQLLCCFYLDVFDSKAVWRKDVKTLKSSKSSLTIRKPTITVRKISRHLTFWILVQKYRLFSPHFNFEKCYENQSKTRTLTVSTSQKIFHNLLNMRIVISPTAISPVLTYLIFFSWISFWKIVASAIPNWMALRSNRWGSKTVNSSDYILTTATPFCFRSVLKTAC